MQENLADMTDEQLNALLAGEPADPAAVEAQPEAIQQQGDITAEAQPTAEQIAAEQAAAVEAQAAPVEQQQAMPMVPIAAVHEERRRRQELQQLLSNPQALAQQLQQFGYQVAEPDQYLDTEAAVQFQVNQATLPLQQENEQLRAYVAEVQQQQAMQRVVQDFGQEAVGLIQQLDQVRPDLAGLDPYLKAAMATGAQWANPQYRQQQIDAKAQQIAEARIAEQLAGSKQTTPVTLAGVTSAQDETAAPDPANLSARDMLGMSDDALDKMIRQRG